MAIVVVKNNLEKDDFRKAKEDYQTYVKITIDTESQIVALGGEYHADAERILLDQGCQQENIWGGGLNLETGQFETIAIINLRAGRNDSTEILDPEKRAEFLSIAKDVLGKHV